MIYPTIFFNFLSFKPALPTKLLKYLCLSHAINLFEGFMDSSYKAWDELSKIEGRELYKKCLLVLVSNTAL